MKAIVLDRNKESSLDLIEVQENKLQPNEVRVSIKAASLNHRDEWCRKGKYPNLKEGVILGSDGAGIIIEVGDNVPKSIIGTEVIINPSRNWGDNPKAQHKDFEILGMPSNGTLAETIVVPLDRVYDKPSHLSWQEAAALPLAGLTAYRALTFHGNIQAGQDLLVTGFGGGVAQFAAQFGLALGAKVSVSSSSDKKLEQAKKLGIINTYNYTQTDWVGQAQKYGGFDLIIDSASGRTLNDLIDVAKPGGKIVFYGATLGNPESIDARKIFWGQLTLQGTTMGTDMDFEAMLEFVKKHKIHPIIDEVFSFGEASEAFDKMRAGQQMGKIILVP
jgi:NADPH:quinone reductase-like Zn-dependent oxidoreductase